MGRIVLKINKLRESLIRYNHISKKLEDIYLSEGKRISFNKELKLIKEEIDSLVKDIKNRGSILKIHYKKDGENHSMLVSQDWDYQDIRSYFNFLSLFSNEKYELVDYKKIQL